MKNILGILFLCFLTISCVCDKLETGRFMIPEENKAYWSDTTKTVTFIDSNYSLVVANFSETKTIVDEEREGPETCHYKLYETGREDFTFKDYKGEIFLDRYGISISLLKDNEINVLGRQVIESTPYDDVKENVQINEFVFNDVIVLKISEESSRNATAEKIFFSKNNGIEFILFKDGSWYKRVE